MENSKIKGSYRKYETALKAVIECLKEYYSIKNFKRNEWRFKAAVEIAKKQLKEKGEVKIIRAQWGGKWGNFYRAVGLNSYGKYEFVMGFNINKELGY